MVISITYLSEISDAIRILFIYITQHELYIIYNYIIIYYNLYIYTMLHIILYTYREVILSISQVNGIPYSRIYRVPSSFTYDILHRQLFSNSINWLIKIDGVCFALFFFYPKKHILLQKNIFCGTAVIFFAIRVMKHPLI